ncbi:MAG: class I SAM-dependent methyltransferase [Nocardioides sp.]
MHAAVIDAGGGGDGLQRSVRLFRSFLTEQTDPEGFYAMIADDATRLMSRHMDLAGKQVADFGGGPGFYSDSFRRAGARSLVLDASYDELTLHGRHDPSAVVALAERSPLADSSVDVAFSSNLMEHVPDYAAVADQMVRVVRPGGFLVLSYTAWLGPWGGHETSPWHYLGGRRAAQRYERKNGHPPKNVYGESMFATSVRTGMRWARSRRDLEILEERPRYLPPYGRHLLRVPGLRELVTWNLWQVLRKV